MTIFTLRLVTTSTDHSSQLRTNVIDALGKYYENLSVTVRRFSTEALEIELKGERAPLDAAHMEISKEFAARYPFVRVMDELGDTLRNEAYPLLGKLEQELRAFINEAMISSGLGIDWLTWVGDEQISTRIMATRQKGQGGIYQHPAEFTELDHLLEIVTVDLAAWGEDRLVTASDMLSLLQDAKNLESVRATLEQRMQKRSFWDLVFSQFFNDLSSWRDWKSRWKKEVINLRNRVMHHRPVFAWEITKLRQTATEFTNLLQQHRKLLSLKDEEKIRQAAHELMASFQLRHDLHVALGGSRQAGISISQTSNSIFLFVAGEPLIKKLTTADGSYELTLLYEGEGQNGDQLMIRGNRAIYEHVADGRDIQIFSTLDKGRGIYHLGQAEYRSHYFYVRENGLRGIMFELVLTPSLKIRHQLIAS